MGFFEFPHTRTYDNDLGWLIRKVISISQTLENFINLNTIRYADPIEWSISTQYEANTVVIDGSDGTAYLSTQPVPSGVLITDTDYWTPIFNYGAEMDKIREQIAASNQGTNEYATRSYDEGDLLWLNGMLYKVTTSISQGAQLITGTNIEETTIEDLLTIEANIKYFDTLAAAKSADLKEDDCVITGGRAAVNDRGGFKYVVKTSGSGIYETADNGLFMVLLIGDAVYPEMFGAVGDGVSDDSTAFQAAVDFCIANKYKLCVKSEAHYLLNTCIYVNGYLFADLSGAQITGADSYVLDIGNSSLPYACDGTTIENIYILGCRGGINIHAKRIRILNGYFVDNSNIAIHTESGSNVTYEVIIDHCCFHCTRLPH